MTFSIRCENLSKLYRLNSQINMRATLLKKMSHLKSVLGISQKKIPLSSSDKMLSENQLANAPEGYFWVLKDINLEIKQGERVALIGRNGSGKSTLLKIFSKITRPTQGLFKFRGRLISLLEVGTGFHHELTGKENIFLNGAIMGMSLKEIKQRYQKIVEFSELKDFILMPVKHYSSGMRVKLAFSVAAFLESEILILDEILAVGDALFQKKCIEKITEISQQEGRTLIFVSHDMRVVQQICDKAIALSHGQILQQDSHELIIRPKLVDDVAKYYSEYEGSKGANLCTTT